MLEAEPTQVWHLGTWDGPWKERDNGRSSLGSDAVLRRQRAFCNEQGVPSPITADAEEATQPVGQGTLRRGRRRWRREVLRQPDARGQRGTASPTQREASDFHQRDEEVAGVSLSQGLQTHDTVLWHEGDCRAFEAGEPPTQLLPQRPAAIDLVTPGPLSDESCWQSESDGTDVSV